VDRQLSERIDAARDESGRTQLTALQGAVAIANAKVAYRRFQEVFGSRRFTQLQARGATPQRPLWASTGTKNPTYRDVLYVEELIGPDSVNTMPRETIRAFQHHGQVERTVDRGIEDARETLQRLDQVGISLDAVTDQLLFDGIELFSEALERLDRAIVEKSGTLLDGRDEQSDARMGVPA
jgi:transaldolase/glucose-6-phosphate isomerase